MSDKAAKMIADAILYLGFMVFMGLVIHGCWTMN